jgi:hypothetical protein
MLDPYQKPDVLNYPVCADVIISFRTNYRHTLLTRFNRVFPASLPKLCKPGTEHTRLKLYITCSASPLSSHKEETGDRHIYNFKDTPEARGQG